MNELHENLFKLLIELDTLCSENNIDYVLSGGTALGAVRNQCFLPWDDDIDLFISRENWYRLYDLVKKNPDLLPENRDLICIENEPFHRNPIIRYVDTSTTRIYASQSIAAKTCGDQIEFFILDPIPNIEDGQKEHLKYMDVFFEVLCPYFLVTKEISIEDYAEHMELVSKYYEKIDKEGFSNVMNELYDEYFTYPIEKADTLRLRWGMRMGLYKAKFFDGKRYELLEGHKFPVAYMAEHALRNDYGDTWMYIPKVEGQISHNSLIEDLNRPFKDFTDIYLRFIDQEEVVNAYDMNKRNNIKLWIPLREIEIEREKMSGIIVKKELDKIIQSNDYNLEQLLKDRNYDLLNQIFERYYRVQLHRNSRKHNIMIDIDEYMQKISILNYIHQGLYYSAADILNIIEANKGLTEDLEHLKELCNYCRSLSIAIYDNHSIEDVNELLDNIPEDCLNLVDTFKAILWLKLRTAKDNEDYESIVEKGMDMLKDYPTDGELMSYIAEAYFKLDNIEKAKEMYDEAVHNTRNGFVWRYAKENVGIDRMAEEELYVNHD